MYTYRMDVSYSGSDHAGWASQPNGKGVQDLLRSSLSRITGELAHVHGASRTDAGVRCLQQICRFRLEKSWDTYKLHRALDAVLPSSIGVDLIQETAADFSPMHHVQGKWYRYYVWNHPCRQALWEQKAWQVPYELDLHLLQHEFYSLLGTHNFRSFCASGSGAKTTTREIFDLSINQYGSLMVFDILGKGFLKHMIRIMIGTLIDVARGQLARSLQAILAAEDRRMAGYTAPSYGLSLMGMYLEDGVRKLAQAKEIARQARPWMACYGLGCE